MARKVFLDINILVDLFDAKRKNHTDAIRLIAECEEKNCIAFLTESVLNTTAYLIRKDCSPQEITELFSHLLQFVELIPVNSVMYSAGLQRVSNDVEDAVLYTAAIHAGVKFFITSNIKDFKKLEIPALPIITAADFLNS